MAQQREYTVWESFLSKLVVEGVEFLAELLRILVNLAMRLERETYRRGSPMNGRRSTGIMPTASSPRG